MNRAEKEVPLLDEKCTTRDGDLGEERKEEGGKKKKKKTLARSRNSRNEEITNRSVLPTKRKKR